MTIFNFCSTSSIWDIALSLEQHHDSSLWFKTKWRIKGKFFWNRGSSLKNVKKIKPHIAEAEVPLIVAECYSYILVVGSFSYHQFLTKVLTPRTTVYSRYCFAKNVSPWSSFRIECGKWRSHGTSFADVVLSAVIQICWPMNSPIDRTKLTIFTAG